MSALPTLGEAESLPGGAMLDAGSGEVVRQVNRPQVDGPDDRLEIVVRVGLVVAGRRHLESVAVFGQAIGEVGFPGKFGGVIDEPGAAAGDVAETQAGVCFPGLGEAAHLVKLGGPAIGHQEPKEAAGRDGTELAVVTDEDQLGVSRPHDVDQGGEVGR